MGILNVTPDSFYKESRVTLDYNSIQKKAVQLISEGADIIDIGAYSSRPGATDVPIEEEIRRLSLGISAIRDLNSEILISVDTFRSDVAKYTIERLGANIINDISGGLLDPYMYETIAGINVPYIINHMRGTPQNMQDLTDYNNITSDIISDLKNKIEKLSYMGVNDIIIDPGFGFSKTLEQNYQLLNQLEIFSILERPILVGISRKSMIYKTLNSSADDAQNGTTVLNSIAILNGASILRVHDVKMATETIKLISKTIQLN